MYAILQELPPYCQFAKALGKKVMQNTPTVCVTLRISILAALRTKTEVILSSLTAQNIKRSLIAAAFVIVSAGSAIIAQGKDRSPADLALFSPAKGVWYSNAGDACAFTAVRWGTSDDVLVPADFDGDGTVDTAVWRKDTGTWMIRRSSDGGADIIKPSSFVAGDVPVAADYDGDGKAERAIWRAATGQWMIENKKGSVSTILGIQGDIPVPADYDGDGKADLAVFRPTDNRWIIQQTSNGKLRNEIFGQAGRDVLVPADYTGDGKADIAVYRSGTWYVLSSETGEIEPFVMGFDDDIPVPADYDGDGVTDMATYRKGTWYIYEGGEPRFKTFQFGTDGDMPIAAARTYKTVSP